MTAIRLESDRVRATVIVGLAVVAAISCIGTPWPENLVLQHVPTVVGLFLLARFHRRLHLGNTAFGAAAIFLLLHIIGARWIYSYVPYDAWSKALFGVSISDLFGFKRNHYDRVVHFAFGLLLFWPVRDIVRGRLRIGDVSSTLFTWSILLAGSLLYEVFEWGLTIALAPDAADAYNGQQGDIWDAQKDMALAALGATIAGTIELLRWAQRQRRNTL
jgi:putative membrane protein